MGTKQLLIGGLVGVAFVLFFIFVYQPKAAEVTQSSRVEEKLHASAKLRKEVVKTVPEFELTDQNGETFTRAALEGKVYITDFFFTTCDAACPMMTSQLTRVQEALHTNEDFKIVSHSLDPEKDTPEALREYAAKYKARDGVWTFLTGDKDYIYDLGETGYLQSVLVNKENIIDHSQKFILVDRDGGIRGFYNGMDSAEVDILINDALVLLYKEK